MAVDKPYREQMRARTIQGGDHRLHADEVLALLTEIDRLARRVEAAERLALTVAMFAPATGALNDALAAWDQASREGE